MIRLVVDHVFQHGSEPQRIKDLRFGLPSQIDRLGVTATFDVEDAVIGPAMFVVADQLPLWIGRQRRLACSGQAEQDRRLARLWVGGCRTVHRQNAPLGHQVVHQREDGLFHFAGILGAQNHDFASFQAQIDAGLGRHARRCSDWPETHPR